MMPGDQFTPVIKRRPVACGHHANAVSMTHGMPSSTRITRRYSNDSISQPAAARRCRKCSFPMLPSKSGLTGAELACIAASSFAICGRAKLLPLVRAESGARQAGGVENELLLGGAADSAKLGHQLAHGAFAAIVGVVLDVRPDQPLKVLRRVPVRRRRFGRLPLLPRWIGRPDRCPLAKPIHHDRRVWVQPGVALRNL